MTEKSLGETCTIDTENIAAMLALIGKEESNTTSPTATVMLTHLKANLKILFDKMIARETKFVTVRLGSAVQLDDHWYEYAIVPKLGNVTKMTAMASVLNSLQQQFISKHLKMISSDEGPNGYEFVIEVKTY